MDRFELLDSLHLRLARGEGWSAAVVAWAVESLETGRDTPSLRILAGLDPDGPREEVQAYFRPTLTELGVEPLDTVGGHLGQARAAAGALLRGELEPRACADLVHRVAVSPLGHPPSLQPWCDLDSGFVTGEDRFVRQLGADELDAEIRALAERFLAEEAERQLATLEAEVGRGGG